MENEVRCLEHSTLKVPYEVLNKKFRTTQKIVDREAAHVAQVGIEFEKLLTSSSVVTEALKITDEPKILENDSSSTDVQIDLDLQTEDELGSKNPKTDIKAHQVAKFLDVITDRLQSLKRKAIECVGEEFEATEKIAKRLQHLSSFPGKLVKINPAEHSPEEIKKLTQEEAWRKTRLNRMLVEHLLRDGLYDTANHLAESQQLKDLTNVEVFGAAKEVEESLRQKETSRMVSWCYENKSKLRKIHSTLELEIRVQEFVELARKGKRLEAVKHARKHIADVSDPYHLEAVKKCMGLLAFPTVSTESPIHPYYELLCDLRWKKLITQFRMDHARIYQLSSSSVLGSVVQAGLASLKTPHCYREANRNPNCPVCSEDFNQLASSLPNAHCAHSQLVCAISGESLNENNPAMVLPNGFVYGTRSLKEMASKNGGKIICLRSGNIYNLSEAERVFVM